MVPSSSSATIARRILVNNGNSTTIRRRFAVEECHHRLASIHGLLNNSGLGSSHAFARQSSRLYHHGNVLPMLQRRPIISYIDVNDYEKNRNRNKNIVMASLPSLNLSFVKLVPEDHLQYRMFSSTTTNNISFSKEQRKDDSSQRKTDNAATSASKAVDSTDTDKKESNTSEEGNKSEKPTFKTMVRQYGPLFITTYLGVYVSTVLGFYAGIESGALDPVYIMSFFSKTDSAANPDSVETVKNSTELILDWLNNHSWNRAASYIETYPWLANFSIAWLATKPTEPIRFGVTVAILPKLARTLGYTKAAKKEE
jgi:hypothetical protein